MKPMLKPFLIALGVASLLPAPAQAQPSPDDKPGHCHRMAPPEPPRHEADMMPGAPLPPFLHGIELTEAQRDSIFSILHADAPVVREKMKAVHKAHEALHALTMSGKYDEARAEELAETIADNMAVLSLLRSRSESRIYALLTPEQRKRIGEAKDKAGPRPASAHFAKPHGNARAI